MQDAVVILPENSYQLIFTIASNPILGYLIEPYAVKKLKSGQWSYDYHRVNYLTAGDYIEKTTPIQASLLEAHKQYCDSTLLKKYNKGKLKPHDFFTSLSPEYVSNHMRPIIDKYMSRMVEIMLTNRMNLYYIGTKGECIRENPIEIAPNFPDPEFHFTRTESGLQYQLKLHYEDSELDLLVSGTYLLAHDPCLLLAKERIYRFQNGWEGKRITPFLTKKMVVIPKASEKAYIQKFVSNVLKYHKVVSSGFQIDVVQKSPVFQLSLEQNWQNHWILHLKFDYGKETFVYGDETPAKVQLKQDANSFSFVKVVRNREEEISYVKKMESLGLVNRQGDGFYLWYPAKRKNESEEPSLAGFFDYLDWMSSKRENLDISFIETLHDTSARRYYLGHPSMHMSVTEGNDWFDLYAMIRFGQFEIPFYKLRNDILAGNREVLLPDGSIGILPAEWLVRYHDILKNSIVKGGKLHLRKHYFTLLDSEKGTTTIFEGRFQNISDFQPPAVPSILNANLRPYQEKGFQWMCFLNQHKMGGCLADDMGLGKTLQALSMLLYAHKEKPLQENLLSDSMHKKLPESKAQLALFEEPERITASLHGTSLLIMPLSLIHNWMQEIKKFAPALSVMQYTGSTRSISEMHLEQYDLILTTYGTVRNDIDVLQKFAFHYILLDESQVIKNAESKTFYAIKRLQAQQRLALTGTPIENSLTDLWAQFSFLNPGLLGTQNYFKEEFVIPIERNKDAQKQKKLQALVEPFMLRRTKAQVARDLPELTETIRYCEMSEEQKKFYEEKKSQIRNLIFEQVHKQGLDKARFFIFSNLMKLRLLANHPQMVDPEFPFDSGKFTAVSQNINDLMAEGHKVLIFSQFVKHLNIYKNYFENNNLPFVMLTGQNTEAERAGLIEEFNTNANKRLFLISLKAGGTGLNLTAADYVFLLDPWWNPAVEKQAINRAHRIGQTKNVFVYKYITLSTVEEKILLLQEKKNHLASMLADRSNPFKNLGLDEISALFG